MPVSIKQVTLNTKVTKSSAENVEKQGGGGGSLTRTDIEVIIEECMRRVKTMIDYELKP